jgi:hypothetical protein
MRRHRYDHIEKFSGQYIKYLALSLKMGIVAAKTHRIAFASEDMVKAATEERVPNTAWQGPHRGRRSPNTCPMPDGRKLHLWLPLRACLVIDRNPYELHQREWRPPVTVYWRGSLTRIFLDAGGFILLTGFVMTAGRGRGGWPCRNAA